VLFWGCFIQNVLFYFAIGTFAFAVSRRLPWSILVAMGFLAVPRPSIGGAFIYNPTWINHSTVASTLLIFAVANLLRTKATRNTVISITFWIFGALVHLPNGVYTFPLIMGMICYGKSIRGYKKTLLLISMITCVVLVVLQMINHFDSNTLSWATFYNLTHFGIGGTATHIFLLDNMYKSRLIPCSFLCIAMLCTTMAAWRTLRFRPFIVGYYSCFSFVLLDYFATEVIKSVSLSRLMWMRVASILFLFGFTFIIAFVPHLLRNVTKTWKVNGSLKIGIRFSSPLISVLLLLFIGLSLTVQWYDANKLFNSRNFVKSDFNTVQVWAEHNTNKNDVFLVPPAYTGWRAISKRSSYLEIWDRAGVVLSDELTKEFIRRSLALRYPIRNYRNLNRFTDIYQNLTDSDLVSLGKSENINFAIINTSKACNLPCVFKTSTLKVIALSGFLRQ
jgi:hypothetical protein